MKRVYLFFAILLIFFAGQANAQSWVTYEADVTPDLADPAWSESNTKAFDYSWEVIADPDIAGNNLLQFNSIVEGGGAMWKTADFDPVPSALTAVFRVKLNEATADRLLELDMHINGMRDQLVIRANNQISLQRSDTTIDVAGLDVTQWNVFRVTLDATAGTSGEINVYLNENPTPVLTTTSSTTTSANYIRFGDGNSSPTYSSLVDFVTYDQTGAYSPAAQAIPAGLLPTNDAGNWVVYGADVTPDLADPAWSESNVKAFDYSWEVNADPEIDGNNLLEFNSLIEGGGAMWKTPDFDPVPSALTAVFRVKQNDVSADRLLELDMHINGIRDQLVIRANNQISLQRSDTTIDVPGLDISAWNIFRVTLDASTGTSGEVNVYLNEDPTPILTTTTTTNTSSNYIRFGDGNSSPTYSSLIDFVSYDQTGAFNPDDLALPEGLIPAIPVGDWITYEADVTPDLADPSWSESNTKAFDYSWEIVADPDVEGNNLLEFNSLIEGGGAMWKTADFDPAPEALTAVFRVKQNDAAADRLVEMDMHINGIRDQLVIRANNQISLQRSDTTTSVPGFDASVWNVFRVTLDASSGSSGEVNVYLNENPVPVLTATTTTTTSSSYIRFGDGNSSPTYSSLIDFVSYDMSGAFSPENTALPAGLIPTPKIGEWIVYEADVTPDLADPAWSESNTKAFDYSWEIVADPEVEGNNLLEFNSLIEGGGAMWKTADFDPVPTALTAVFRVKQNDVSADRLLELDMHINGIRDQLVVRANNQISLQRSDSTIDVNGLDISEWNVFRVTLDATAGTSGLVNVYLNENPTPILTTTTTTTTGANYIRFGDGNSSPTYSSFIDFVSYDVTGAFSPQQRILPPGLIPGTDDGGAPVPVIKAAGSPDALSQDLGLAGDFTVESYIVSGIDLTDDITITPPQNFEVSQDQTVWFTSDNPLTLSPTEGTVSNTTIFVRLNATATGDFSGEITHSSDGAENVLISVSGTVIDLIPEITITGTLQDFVQNLSSPSAAQSLRVSGINLKEGVSIAASENFEVSGDDETWSSELLIEETDRTITNALFYVRMSASALGATDGTVSLTSLDAQEVIISVSGEVIPDPGITVTGQLTSFTQQTGTPSEMQSYTVSGANLASGIKVTVPEGFEISFSGTLWLPSLELSPLEGDVETITLFVRMNASEEKDYSGNIVHSSEGVEDVNLAVSGTAEAVVLSSDRENTLSVSLWPNPASEVITLSRADIARERKVTIYTLAGNKVASHSLKEGIAEVEIDVSTLEQGVYLLEYQGDEKPVIKRFIKN